MMEDKNINRLFQEKLKDLEVTPNPKIWQNIESKLTKKKKRRIIPFWWLSSGVAAILLISLLITNQPKEDIINAPVLDDNFNNPIVETEELKKNIEKEPKLNVNEVDEEEIVPTKVVRNTSKKSIKNNQENKIEIAQTSNKVNTEEKNAISNKKRLETTTKTKVNTEKLIAKATENLSKNTTNQAEKKVEEKNAIAALVEEEKRKQENKKEDKKWSVTPLVGIIASSAFSGGSALDESFNSNTISSDETLVYGMKVSYQMNNKWSLRTGIQFQKNIYYTENVGLVSNLFSSTNNSLSGVNLNANNQFNFVSLESNEGGISTLNPSGLGGNSTEKGSLAQIYSYFEIPVEIQYQFYESRTVKTQLVTGFSTLFLNDNNITLNTSALNQKIGEANNLNSLNFSGNFGVNVDVQITKQLNFNFNPMLKAQLNTFSENSNGFTPFIFGVYSGVTFGF